MVNLTSRRNPWKELSRVAASRWVPFGGNAWEDRLWYFQVHRSRLHFGRQIGWSPPVAVMTWDGCKVLSFRSCHAKKGRTISDPAYGRSHFLSFLLRLKMPIMPEPNSSRVAGSGTCPGISVTTSSVFKEDTNVAISTPI